jgi:hypothetical protein
LGQYLHRCRRASKACATSMLRTGFRVHGLVRTDASPALDLR